MQAKIFKPKDDLRTEWTNYQFPIHILEILNQAISFEDRVNSNNDRKDNENLFEEYEIKFKYFDKLPHLLKDSGARYLGACVEKSVIFDDDAMSLHAINARLRIRTFYDLYGNNNTSLVTLKQPKPKSSQYGMREFEAETLIKDTNPNDVEDAFYKNGLKKISSYERIRHYVTTNDGMVKIDVDLLPDIGRFVEMEGNEAAVLAAARSINVDLSALIDDPYDTIHFHWRSSLGQPEEMFIEFKSSLSELMEIERGFFHFLKDKHSS